MARMQEMRRGMRWTLGVLCAGALAAALPAWAQTAKPMEKQAAKQPAKTINLVTEATQNEWTRVAIPPTHPVSKVEQWHVDAKEHVIVCDGNGGHDWLRFDKEFSNFALHVEWRFTPIQGETHYNSGVFFRNSQDGTIWHQAQTTLDGGYVFGQTPMNGKLTSFNLQKQMKQNRVKAAGKWNTYEIRCVGKTCTLAVNGMVVNTVKVGVTKGYVGLESEGYQIEFRNVKVTELGGKE